MKWFTSDLHLNHKNICHGVSEWEGKRGTRDFPDLIQMNVAILNSINSRVKEGDTLYILGDFAFGDKSIIPMFRDCIQLQDVRFLYGNHDAAIEAKYQDCFNNIKGERGNLGYYGETRIADRSGKKHGVVMFHYNIGGVWNKAGAGYFHIFGHSHGSMPLNEVKGKAFDIGWDVFQKPLNEHEVCDIMEKIGDNPKLDHHDEKTSFY